jgi:branched-chain amino acid aminotransferase
MPEATRALAQLWAVTPDGPIPIPAPGGGSPTDLHALLKGVPPGVYSALRTFHHERFLLLEEHIARTVASMRGLGWDYELDDPGLRRALQHVVREWPGADSRVRFDVLERASPELDTSSRVLLGVAAFEPVPARFLREGVRVGIAQGLERRQPRIKTTEFIQRRAPFPLATQESYEHLLVEGRGRAARILEGSSSNFFGVERGGLRTSGPGVLEGITRKIVLRVAGALGIAVDETPIPLAGVGALAEAFLTSSTRGIVPVVGVAETTIADGRPGALTRRLMAAYAELAEREARPAL